MRPPSAFQDVPNGASADAEGCADTLRGYACRSSTADRPHAAGCQLRVPSTLAVVHAVARHGVSGVVGMGTEIQMIWADAAFVVAVMQDPETGRDRAVGEFPRQAVRGPKTVVDMKHAVGRMAARVLEPRRGPFPASLGLRNLRPEPLHMGILTSMFQT